MWEREREEGERKEGRGRKSEREKNKEQNIALTLNGTLSNIQLRHFLSFFSKNPFLFRLARFFVKMKKMYLKYKKTQDPINIAN